MGEQAEALTATWHWDSEREAPDDVRWVGWSGGISPAPSREEYLQRLRAQSQDYERVFLALEAGVKRQGLIGLPGEAQDLPGGWWELSDGRAFGCTWRAWGDIMQAIVDKREGYLRYYMGHWTPSQPLTEVQP